MRRLRPLCCRRQSGGGKFSLKNDCIVPVIEGKTPIADSICPAKGYAIKSLGCELYGDDGEYDINLGYTTLYAAARATDENTLANATSGGVITEILLYLLERKIVDKVSVTQFVCDEGGVKTHSFLTDNKTEILKAQGSKYCPVNHESLIKELHEYEGKVAVMATPCVIAGIRNIQKHVPDYIRAEIVFTIANFCGGFKSQNNIKRLAKIHHVNYYNLKEFHFRGEGQPGCLRFTEKNGKTASTPYPNYVGLNGYSKMLRCHLCVDAMGELADISCGDAFLKRFKDTGKAWSVILCRNDFAKSLINEMSEGGRIVLNSMSKEEVVYSQRFNLASKKRRGLSRRKLYKWLGYQLPDFHEEGYDLEPTSITTEIKVYIKHKLTLWAEYAHLYMLLYGRKKLT